jgi:hypothetical protein
MKEKIIAKIYETCPELKALEFGCRVIYGSDEFEPREVTIGVPYEIKGNRVFNPYCADDQSFLLEIFGKEIHLTHLLRTIGEKDGNILLDAFGLIQYWSDGMIKTIPYDLTKSVSENLENEELCSFLYKIICE